MPHDTSKHSMTKLILWGAGLLLVLGIVSLAFIPRTPVANTNEALLSDAIRLGQAPVPTYTPQVQKKLTDSKGFQALVSYTDNGFEPATTMVQSGETVRFTNNSSHPLKVVQKSGETVYATGACDSAAFESCATIAPQDFWEFTFTKPGRWTFVNALDAARSGAVQVQ